MLLVEAHWQEHVLVGLLATANDHNLGRQLQNKLMMQQFHRAQLEVQLYAMALARQRLEDSELIQALS